MAFTSAYRLRPKLSKTFLTRDSGIARFASKGYFGESGESLARNRQAKRSSNALQKPRPIE
jgi:hypothetical protein